MKPRLTTEQFIERAKIKHSNRFSYSNTVYTHSHENVIITCPEHGDFEQKAYLHLKGNGCQLCRHKTVIKEKVEKGKKTKIVVKPDKTKIFIEKARAKHGDKYDYSKTVYKHSQHKVIITCPTHGDFEQRPDFHLQGRNCRECAVESLKGQGIKTTEQFIKDARAKHGDKYDYSKTVYKHSAKHVTIICPEHGEYRKTPVRHLSDGSGCPLCGWSKPEKVKTTEQFIAECNEVHNNKYDYSKTEYVRAKYKVIVTCPDHGDFEQMAYSHAQGHGCMGCKVEMTQSQQEIELQQFVNTLGLHFISSDRTQILNKQTGNYLELDLWFPDYMKAIEFNGEYWHSFPNVIERDLFKQEECARLNIDLLVIHEQDWNEDKDGCLHRVANFLGVYPCDIMLVS